jgi:hypothetical protein
MGVRIHKFQVFSLKISEIIYFEVEAGWLLMFSGEVVAVQAGVKLPTSKE